MQACQSLVLVQAVQLYVRARTSCASLYKHTNLYKLVRARTLGQDLRPVRTRLHVNIGFVHSDSLVFLTDNYHLAVDATVRSKAQDFIYSVAKVDEVDACVGRQHHICA